MTTLTRVEELASVYYDFYKDVHGVRPRWIYGANKETGVVGCIYSEQEMEKMMDDLKVQARHVFAEEEKREQEAIAEFEGRVQKLIKQGAQTRETAIRWLVQAENDSHMLTNPDYFCFNYGLPYGYFKNETWLNAQTLVVV